MITTTASAVSYEGDGRRQVFPFAAEDGVPIPHEDNGHVAVAINGTPLAEQTDYTINKDRDGTVITLLRPLAVGSTLDLERTTPLVQPKQFRRSGDWDVSAVERAFDRITCAVQDAFWRIAKIEKVIRVEHRTVEIPAETTPALVISTTESAAQQSPDQSDAMVERIIDSVSDVIQSTCRTVAENQTQLAARVERLEQALAVLYDKTGEPS